MRHERFCLTKIFREEEVEKSNDDDEKRDEGKSEESCDGKLCQEHDVSLIEVVPSPPSTSKVKIEQLLYGC